MEVSVTGIENLSSHRPQFTIIPEFGGLLFSNSATAANAVITNEALLNFVDTSTAEHATITTVTVTAWHLAAAARGLLLGIEKSYGWQP